MWELLGLNDVDERVYRFELRSPGTSATEVARSTDLDPETVTASRERLLSCGLLRRDLYNEVRPNPTGPTAVADRLREELEAEHARRRRQVSLFQAEMTRWVHDQILTAPALRPQIDRLPSWEAALVRAEELLVNARAEVARCLPTEPFWPRARADAAIPAELRAMQRGAAVRVIYPPAQLTSERARRAVDHEIRAGLAVRIAAAPETNMIIVDRSAALVIDHRNPADVGVFLIHEAPLVRTLQDLFDIGWMHAGEAATFLRDEGAGDPGISADERLLLQLLGEGLKDEAVAKKLGVSVRTVRRKIYELQQRLGADSRFQAGMLAAHRDWV